MLSCLQSVVYYSVMFTVGEPLSQSVQLSASQNMLSVADSGVVLVSDSPSTSVDPATTDVDISLSLETEQERELQLHELQSRECEYQYILHCMRNRCTSILHRGMSFNFASTADLKNLERSQKLQIWPP